MPSEIKTRQELLTRFKKKCEESALTPGDAKRLAFTPMMAEEVKTLGYPSFAGFKIPYFKDDGRINGFHRFRYLESTKVGFHKLTKEKDLRYTQPASAVPEVYLPPLLDTTWHKFLRTTDEDGKLQSVIITEGELKAACACKFGIPTIGLGGVWNFRSKKGVIEFFENTDWDHRVVYICYDSDAAANPNVLLAENSLARVLTDRGAIVYILRLPHVLDGSKKTGLDDFLVQEDGYAKFGTLLKDSSQEYKASQALHELNAEVMYVRDVMFVMEASSLRRMKPIDFVKHAYANKLFEIKNSEGKVKLVSAAEEWIKWPARLEVESVTYEPEGPRITIDKRLNVWPGYGKDGMLIPEKSDTKRWKMLLDNLFKTDTSGRIWFEQWLAYPLQYPGTKLASAVIMWGRQTGTGKTTVGVAMKAVYGKNAVTIGDKELEESFNPWAENRQFVMGDEITSKENKRHLANRMKSMITQNEVWINKKFSPQFVLPDCINYYYTSNHPDAFIIDTEDRRYFVHEADTAPLSKEFYAEFNDWLEGPGAAALLYYFKYEVNTEGFEPKMPPPMTAAKMDMTGLGRSDLGDWCHQLHTDPDSTLRLGEVPLPWTLATSEDLLAIYDPLENKRVSPNGMGRALREAGFYQSKEGVRIPSTNKRQRLWFVRSEAHYRKIKNEWDLGRIYDQERTSTKRRMKIQ